MNIDFKPGLEGKMFINYFLRKRFVKLLTANKLVIYILWLTLDFWLHSHGIDRYLNPSVIFLMKMSF